MRSSISVGCSAAVENILPMVEETFSGIDSVRSIMDLAEPEKMLRNIPLIGTIGVALAASTAGHAAAGRLNDLVGGLVRGLLEQWRGGLSEGVCYDGYIMDFVADWLPVAAPSLRDAILAHPALDALLDKSIYLSVPGEAVDVAELGDVEPVEMPFHISAHAKLCAMRTDERAGWFVKRCSGRRLRADALGVLWPQIDGLAEAEPEFGVLDAHCAVVFRNGYERRHVAVAVSACNSQMPHIQHDFGSVVIGSEGRWLVTDPGYQQYLDTSERVFTVGAPAHNIPVIAGRGLDRKKGRVEVSKSAGNDCWERRFILTECYPVGLGLDLAERTVRFDHERGRIFVGDRIEGPGITTVFYHWHGHADGAWWCEDGWARISIGTVTLWIGCAQETIAGADIFRLRGSRGQMSLVKEVDAGKGRIGWVFQLGHAHPGTLKWPE